ncbi:ABC transporter substrate-binding protein [Subtercola boreus]|uniref:ABC transporter substrate-binding protein n=1 Tax=Subtercola boreus TaxID=120213 RepID=A0A3E0W7E2_9MICO|nr:ABC transporter substrate-binding protein [Subtercola boreus]RFA18160.1 ABC transporter substrate-binding protein [Subtercola boreus]RFA18542.1 ABC transporter substrate-binding protein [Subtercola boreus]RFA25070.1 ABC transporter substrate-binding protein [Subtercola boreus]
MKLSLTRKRARAAIAALAIVPLLALAACSSSSSSTAAKPAPTDGVLTVGLLGDIGQPPDPDVYYANNGLAIVLNTYEGLVQYTNNIDHVDYAPRLATSWTISPDNTVFTFTLRSGVTFHDGTPFNSAAVKASFDRRTAVGGGASYMTAGIASVATPDDLTAVVTLSAPNSAFLDYLASPFGPKMESPTGLAANAGSDNAQTYLQTHDLGTGPYTLTDAEVGTKYGLTQYDKYWGTISPFTTVELPVYNDASALQLAIDSGDVSVSVANLPSTSLSKYENNAGFNSDLLPTLQSALITTNPSKSFFATKEARQAFMSSIDQAKLVSQVLGDRSEPATTLYAKGMITDGSDKQNITYDPTVMASYAKTLPSGTSMVLGYASDNTNAMAMANIVAANLQADGIQATAQGFPTSEVFGWANDPTQGPDAFIDGNNGPDGGSPYMWGHVFWDKTGGINYFLCDDPSTDADLNQAVQTGDTALYAKAAQTYSATGCYMNLSYNKDWVVSQKWVAGVAEAHNLGANELDFSKLTIAK